MASRFDPQLVIQHPLWNSELMKALSQLQLQGSMCDATLDCSDGIAVYAHSAVLAAASRRMHSLLSGDNQGLYTLRMKNTTSSTWRLVLRFLYDGCVVLSPSDVKSVRDTAVRFEIRRLIEALSPVASTTSVTDTVAVGDVIDLDPDNDNAVEPTIPVNDSNNIVAHTAMPLDTVTTADVIVVLDDAEDDIDHALADALQYANKIDASPTQTISGNMDRELTVMSGNLATVHSGSGGVVNQSSVAPDVRSNSTAGFKMSLLGEATANRQCFQSSSSLPVIRSSDSCLPALCSTIAMSGNFVLENRLNVPVISSCDMNMSTTLAAGDDLNQGVSSQHSSKRRLNFGQCEDSASCSGSSVHFPHTNNVGAAGDHNSPPLRCIAPNFSANSHTVNSIRCPLVCPAMTSSLHSMLTSPPILRLNPLAAFGSQPSAFRATTTTTQPLPCRPPVAVVDQNSATSSFLAQVDMCNSVLNLSKPFKFPENRSSLPVSVAKSPSVPEAAVVVHSPPPTVAVSCRDSGIISSDEIQTVTTTTTSQPVAVRSHAMDSIANSCKHSVADVATSCASSPSSAELLSVFPFSSAVDTRLPAHVIDSKMVLSWNLLTSSSSPSNSCTASNGCMTSCSNEIDKTTAICETPPDIKLPFSTLTTQSSRKTVPIVVSPPVAFPQRLSVRSKMPICGPVRTPQFSSPQQNLLQYQLPSPLSSTATIACHRRQTAIRSKAPIHKEPAVKPTTTPVSNGLTHRETPVMPHLQPACLQQKPAEVESVVMSALPPRAEVTNSLCKQAPLVKRRKGCRGRRPKNSVTSKSCISSDESDAMPNTDIADDVPPNLSRVVATGNNSSNSINTPPKRSSDSGSLDGSSSSAKKKLLVLTADDSSGRPTVAVPKTFSCKSKANPVRRKPGRPPSKKAVKEVKQVERNKPELDVSAVRNKRIRFVGRRIHHEWIIVQETGERKWYQGEVIELISGVDGEPGSRYRIHYDDEDAEYEIDHLVEDYREGSVVVI